MELQAIRQAASQGTISLPPPRDSEILEDVPILKLCLKVTRQLSDFRHAFACTKHAETIGRLMLALEARHEVLEANTRLSLKYYFLSRIVPKPEIEEFVRMENFSTACLDLAETLRIEPISVRTVTSIANHFLQDNLAWRKSGEFPKDPSVEDVSTVIWDQIPEQLEKWEEFARNQRDMDPLVHIILISLYYVAISPLNKYNEKIAQILMQLLFLQPSVGVPFPCLQLGYALKTNPHLGLEEKRYGWRTRRWTPYLTYALTTILKASVYSLEILQAIERLFDQTANYLKQLGMANHIAFLPVIFEYPACRTGELSSLTGVRRQVASHILNDLVHAGVLERIEDGRDRIFFHLRLLELLENETHSFAPLPRELVPFDLLYQKGNTGRNRKDEVL
ncbi:MAG: hypothetical protein IJ022_05910 [Burkholderiaceae bacterium]|nr:hypothetical protein [Burkholderiaceae bacterium]